MKACLAARICEGSGWYRTAVADEPGCSLAVERCSSVDARLGWERERELGLGFGSYSCGMGLGHVEVGLSDHHLGSLDCSISHHKSRHRIDLICRMGRRSCVELHLVDIVTEQLVELAVVELEGQLANDLR